MKQQGKIGDLHCHTQKSDGSESLEKVVHIAKQVGMDFLAVTDHDYLTPRSELDRLEQQYGIPLIQGVELSCYDHLRGRRVHLLCYEPKNPQPIVEQCRAVCQKRTQTGEEMLKLVQQEYPIAREDVMEYASKSEAIFKQHIMAALMGYGITNQMFGDLFRQLFSSKGGKAYIKIAYPDVREILPLVRQAQGIAVLAHPYEYDSLELLEELGGQGLLDGVECYHSRCTHEGEEYLLGRAEHFGLVVTGGSDYHGFNASRISPLGNRYTPWEHWLQLKEMQVRRYGKE